VGVQMKLLTCLRCCATNAIEFWKHTIFSSAIDLSNGSGLYANAYDHPSVLLSSHHTNALLTVKCDAYRTKQDSIVHSRYFVYVGHY
jgi:hypothetical protein